MRPLLLAFTFVSSAPIFCLAAPPAHSTPAAPVALVQESYIKESRGISAPGVDNSDVLQTEIRRFDPLKGNGPSIYLVAVTHIGEKSYYKQLQQFLDKQDVVLFEGVRPSRIVAKAGQTTKTNTASTAKGSVGIQKKLANALNLQFQLEGIHYNRPQFHDSDMDWDTLTTLAKKAGVGTEKVLAELHTSMSEGFNTSLSGRLLNYTLTQASARPFLSNMLRRVLITVLADPDIEEKSATPDLAKLESILVVERNRIVLADLTALLKTSKGISRGNVPKPIHSIALFYGAGHMKDMGQHLTSDLGYHATSTQWLTAIRAAG